MIYYQLTGSASNVRRVIEHFALRVEKEHSSTRIDVEVNDDEADDVEAFAESLGVDWKEI